MKPVIHIKRIYDDPSPSDGIRILIDRLWPRGIAKEKPAIDEWAKELAPTAALRKWFDHKPERWAAFQKKYTAELKSNESVSEFIKAHQKDKSITLLYAGKDEAHTHALVLKVFLEKSFR